MWQPWPTTDVPPDLHLACALARAGHRAFAGLVGQAVVGPRGRYGIVGISQGARSLSATRDDLAASLQPVATPRVVLWGYEAGAPAVHLEPVEPPGGQPHGLLMDLDAWLVVDHERRTMRMKGDPAGISQLVEYLEEPPVPMLEGHAALVPHTSDADHMAAIARAQEHIAAGDIYQANVTRRLNVEGDVDVATVFARLAQANPVPHGALVAAGDVTVLSNSMETLLTFHPETRQMTSLPIKGTRPTGDDRPLQEDPKELAEHVMIVDLVRNDLGRVATPGSVHVRPWFDIERYRGVSHGVSTVRGELASPASLVDAVLSLFPGGSITGAPKRRAVEILRTLEPEARGFYTGSIGLVMPRGQVSLSILIRTLVEDARGWTLGVGGGITAGSIPASEVEETHHKVAVFREALGLRSVA